MSFKIGDRVRVNNNPWDNKLEKGHKSLRRKIGTVVELGGYSGRPLIRLDDWFNGHGPKHNEWWIDPEDLTLVKEAVEAKPEPVLKFPIGTKVIWCDSEYTVVDHDGSDFLPYKIAKDPDNWEDDLYSWEWSAESSLRLAPTPSDEGLYIVIVEDGETGKLAPASTPKTYATRKLAQHVADDMAKRHGGKFFVFKAVAESTAIISRKNLD